MGRKNAPDGLNVIHSALPMLGAIDKIRDMSYNEFMCAERGNIMTLQIRDLHSAEPADALKAARGITAL